jgi:HSP20 family protein
MSNLTRWEPAREMISLREAMDRLFNEAFTLPFWPSVAMPTLAVDMYQSDDEVVIRAALPGLKPNDVEISITGDLLTIKGEFKEKTENKEKAYHLREHRYGAFERTISLPTEVVADKAKAEFEDGILTITLPKAEEAKPKVISIKVK